MSHTIVIFGASGDLTTRKLIPALYRLWVKRRLPVDTKVLGVSRTEFSHDAWRKSLAESTAEFAGKDFDEQEWQSFAKSVFYMQGDIGKSEDFQRLSDVLDEIEQDSNGTRVFYLSTTPRLYATAVANLGAAGLADESNGPRRIVIEKPFGYDAATARQLNDDLHQVFAENQVYRIDHYLGKETVQNLFVLRFANSIFEPVWNRQYVDHVQITVAEELAVGHRGDYYDTSGVLRDMFQNHLLQLMMITAMEAPARMNADLIRDEKAKVLQSVRPITAEMVKQDTIRGQYEGYRQEKGVAADSQTATFAALKLHVDNWRWSNVPFYLRSGKALSCRTTQIVIQFREPPQSLFSDQSSQSPGANRLVIQVQPAEGIQLHFHTKVPDAGMKLRMTDLDFSFQREFAFALPDAYQRLLLDVLNGDASLFARSDEVELSWDIIDPVIEAWKNQAEPNLDIYPPALWGPEESMQWMADQGREWFDVCPLIT
ncbi:Glucose-6-phosphate 1-dehydrogenase [Symmachiella macrocystis]|uniref:Glucose-6-phosphate 1-dehydrogenase n=1 Tax=Symmachiella macrocystis TaxID=2527985 RepID=A0A5C6BJ54_9PLAN|nr:glucose-6-phosphate dehydrogenase [Symmachiella macrocystis]TWU11707.1 Glucose-6-phosphate 1-dehydrogenase [Symmachiella macrocystis]